MRFLVIPLLVCAAALPMGGQTKQDSFMGVANSSGYLKLDDFSS